MRLLNSILATVVAVGSLAIAAPAFAAVGTVTLHNASTTLTFTKEFESLCGVANIPVPTSLAPGQTVTFSANCSNGVAAAWRWKTTSGKRCTLNADAIAIVPPFTTYTFDVRATSSGTIAATCTVIPGARNSSTGAMTNTFNMQ